MPRFRIQARKLITAETVIQTDIDDKKTVYEIAENYFNSDASDELVWVPLGLDDVEIDQIPDA